MKVSVVKETAPGERRVALVPEAVVKLRAAGLEVLVESGAGDGAWVTDDAYRRGGRQRREPGRRARGRRGADGRASPTPRRSRPCGPARP